MMGKREAQRRRGVFLDLAVGSTVAFFLSNPAQYHLTGLSLTGDDARRHTRLFSLPLQQHRQRRLGEQRQYSQYY